MPKASLVIQYKYVAVAIAALLSAFALGSHNVFAHGDHGAAAPTAAADAPKREPDGTVFLPKVSQRQLGVRTMLAAQTDEARATELPGRVILDPQRGGRVQPTQAGRLQPGPRGMPQPGQRVTRGEVIAYVVSSVSAIDAANQRASAAETNANLETAKRRLARLEQLVGSVGAREALIAPVSGVVASVAANAIAGQVVDARDVLFEITDPTSLTIEAVAFDATSAVDIARAAFERNGESVPLVFAGGSRALREGQIPLVFRASFDKLRTGSSGKNSLKGPQNGEFPVTAIGESVRVVVQSKSTQSGVAMPKAALVKSPSNQDIVWVVSESEHYVPRVVRFAPLDGARVLLLDGVKPGERVVVSGAPLINQVR
jgi:membrane fusion protein, heavy metal efflux system